MAVRRRTPEDPRATMIQAMRTWARRIKRDAMTLWFARVHPATPWYARALGVFVVAYALSPIDLIPDFIPVLGYLDDVILLPLLIWLAIRMLPQSVLDESRQQAERWMAEAAARPRSLAGAAMVVAIWIMAGLACAWCLSTVFAP